MSPKEESQSEDLTPDPPNLGIKQEACAASSGQPGTWGQALPAALGSSTVPLDVSWEGADLHVASHQAGG